MNFDNLHLPVEHIYRAVPVPVTAPSSAKYSMAHSQAPSLPQSHAPVYVDPKDRSTWPSIKQGAQVAVWFSHDLKRSVMRDTEVLIDFLEDGAPVFAWAYVPGLDLARVAAYQQAHPITATSTRRRGTQRRFCVRVGKGGHEVIDHGLVEERMIATSTKSELARFVANACNMFTSS